MCRWRARERETECVCVPLMTIQLRVRWSGGAIFDRVKFIMNYVRWDVEDKCNRVSASRGLGNIVSFFIVTFESGKHNCVYVRGVIRVLPCSRFIHYATVSEAEKHSVSNICQSSLLILIQYYIQYNTNKP